MTKKRNPSKQQKVPRNTRQVQKVKLISQTKPKFFDTKKQKTKTPNKQTQKEHDMLRQVQFQAQSDQTSQTHRLTGRINYEWFSTQYCKKVPAQDEQALLQHQQLIETRLRQIDHLITNKQRNWQQQVFGKRIWTIPDHSFSLHKQTTSKGSLNNLIGVSNSPEVKENNDFRKILCYVSESRAQQLIMKKNISQILLMFSHVEFRSLKLLHLQSQIYSLEPLQWMDCPNLSKINLHHTPITNSKALSKLYSQKLHTLSIKNTKLQLLELSRIKMKKGGNLQLVSTYHFNLHATRYTEKQQIMMQDIGTIAKAETGWNSFKRDQSLFRNRIYQQFFMNLIEGRSWTRRGIIDYSEESQPEES